MTGVPREPESLGGRYHLLRRLGEGGMGVVYAARDTQTETTVALKLLSSAACSSKNLMRFKREFRAATRMSHPGCAQVYELAETGPFYYTMEYLAGGNARLAQPLSAVDAVALALQVLAALDYVHCRQVVHRDIKPENVLLAQTPVPGGAPVHAKIADFGIAKVGDFDERRERALAIGSPRYIAPEVIRTGAADPRSDLYAVGIMLYEWLVGQHPLEITESQRSLTWWDRHLEAEVVHLPQMLPDIAPEVAAWTQRLCQRDPDARPMTAAHAYRGLRAWWDAAAAPAALPEHPALLAQGYLAETAFVGRQEPLQTVQQFLGDALQPNSQAPWILFVPGEPGLGKSTLLGEVSRLATHLGATVSWQTSSREPGTPFAEVDSFARSLVRHTADLNDDTAKTREDSRPEQATAWVTLRNTDAGDGPQAEQAMRRDQAGQLRFKQRFAEQLRAAAQAAPRVWILDDAQWAEDTILDLLAFVARTFNVARDQGDHLPVVLVIGHRPVAEGHGLAALRSGAGAKSTTLTLRPFDAEEAQALVARMLMLPSSIEARRLADKLWAAAAGNPLFISQALRDLLLRGVLRTTGDTWDLTDALREDAALARTIQEAIGEQAARLSIETKNVLAAAAVVGKSVSLDALAATTNLPKPLLLDCLDEAIRATFLVEEDGGLYTFVHDRLRESLYEQLPLARRMALHLQVVTHLEDLFQDDAERAADLSHHCEAAGDDVRAAHYAVLAARQAMAHYAFAQAATLYDSAFKAAKRAGLALDPTHLERYGDACVQCRRYDAASAAYTERLAGLSDPVARAALALKHARVTFDRGDRQGGLRLLTQIGANVGLRPATPGLRTVLVCVGGTVAACVLAAVPEPWRRARPRYLEDLRTVTRIAVELTLWSLHTRSPLATLYYNVRGVWVGLRIGPCPEAGLALCGLAALLGALRQRRAAHRILAQARRFAGTDPTCVIMAHATEALLRMGEGDGQGAFDALERALPHLPHGPQFLRATASVFYGAALVGMGRLQEGRSHLQRLARQAAERQEDHVLANCNAHLAWTALITDAPGTAVARMVEPIARLRELAHEDAATLYVVRLVAHLAALGKPDQAWEHLAPWWQSRDAIGGARGCDLAVLLWAAAHAKRGPLPAWVRAEARQAERSLARPGLGVLQLAVWKPLTKGLMLHYAGRHRASERWLARALDAPTLATRPVQEHELLLLATGLLPDDHPRQTPLRARLTALRARLATS